MQIVIDIEKKDYDRICGYSTEYIQSIFSEAEYRAVTAIRKGTPLPKGHEDLIDRGEVIKSIFDYHNGKKTIGQCIDDVLAIIEADKKE